MTALSALRHRPGGYRPFGTLRLLLAVAVAFDHCRFLATPDFAAATTPWLIGNIGVMTFFVLSGFIICEALDVYYRSSLASFLANRALRILPAYYIALAISMAAHYVISRCVDLVFIAYDRAPEGMFGSLNIATNIVLPFDWYGIKLVGLENIYPFVRYVWAVSVEVQFYLVAALIALLVRVTRKRKTTAVGMFMFCLVLHYLYYYDYSSPLYVFSFSMYFILGSCLYAWNKTGEVLYCVGALLSGALAVRHYYIYSGSTAEAAIGASIVVALSLLIVLLAGATPSGLLKRADRYLGDLSYPIYLNHYVISIVLLTVTPIRSGWLLVLGLILSFLLSAGIAAILEPTLRRSRDALRGVALR